MQNLKCVSRRRKLVRRCLVFGLMAVIVLGLLSNVSAQSGSGSSELELAFRHLPYLQFKAGERFFPVDVAYHLNNSVLKRWVSEATEVVVDNPTVSDVASKDEDHFLASKLANLSQIAADYEQRRESLGYTVYGRVVKQSSFIVVQYWFFYIYNDASFNEHEGDWEMIQIIMDVDENPVSAVYSQHLAGQRALWSDVEKVNGTHPMVYVARGSHANYFRSYQGKLGLESDEVGADGFSLSPSDLELVLLGEMGLGNHPSSQDWLDFGGRWGNWAKLADAIVGFAGPYGPGHGDNSDKWYYPVSWGESVNAVNGMWFTMSWVAANFFLMFVAVTVVLAVWKTWGIVKLKKKGGLRLPALLRTKALLGITLGIVAIVLIVAGMLLPWYSVKANIETGFVSTQGEADLLIMDGQRGLLVNILTSGRGLAPVFSLQIPFGIVLLAGVVFGLLDILGVNKAKGLGNKYLRGGIAFLILFIILVLFIVQLASAIQALASTFGLTMPPEAAEMAQTISQQPLQGSQTQKIGDHGSVYLSWGLGLGAYMFLAAAIVKLLGGTILRVIPEPQAETEKAQSPPPPPEKE